MDTTLYDTLKTLHVLAAALWVGGNFALNISVTLAFRSRDAKVEANMLKTTEFIGQRIFMPLSLIVLAMGIWMVAKFDLLFDFSDFWVGYGFAGFIATFITGVAFLGPQSGKVAAALEAGANQEDIQAKGRKLMTIARFDLLVLISVICIMVIKP